MYFKRLEIVGFKSFMDKTVLNFEPGITAVVGPNGCGKSNIFDSIRWVLGEQSVKSLRGAQMEDVIFNGTDTKQPLGMAEVSLTFDNSAKFFPVDHQDVMITRRIFRSGESEYLLNKTQVRLKDILDLLLGTGIGAESYSIIAQGKIDLVLSSRPEDRRIVFDEASGITKYKAQKRETLRKLEETEQNLLRISDIITEVKRSIGYLERQANKARRYQEAFQELKGKELVAAGINKDILTQERDSLIKELETYKVQEESLTISLKEAEDALRQRTEELKCFEESLAAIKDALSAAQNQIKNDNQHIVFNQQRIGEMENSKKYLQEQIIQTQERFSADQEKLSKLREEFGRISSAIQEKTMLLEAKEKQLHELSHLIHSAHEAIAQTKKKIVDLAVRISQEKNTLNELHSKEQVFQARQKRLELEHAKVIEEKAQTEGNLSSLSAEVANLENEYHQLSGASSSVKQELESEAQALNNMTVEVEDLERRKHALISQKEFLEKLKNQYDDISESMNATIILDKLPSENITGLVVKVHNLEQGSNKLIGEAKPIDLDAQQVSEKIRQVEEKIVQLSAAKQEKQSNIQKLTQILQEYTQKIQEQELALSNKKTVCDTIQQQCNKIKEEEEIVILELHDVHKELGGLEGSVQTLKAQIEVLENEHKSSEQSIHQNQESINTASHNREEVLVVVAQLKTEVDNMQVRMATEQAELSSLEEACKHDEAEILSMQQRIQETSTKQEVLQAEIQQLKENIDSVTAQILAKENSLQEMQLQYNQLSLGLEDMQRSIEERKKSFDLIKDQVYNLQMKQKDVDFKYQSLKERLMQSYKIDLETYVPEPVPADVPVQPINQEELAAQIQALRDKVGNYGTVNLVAIEEYDELKKRYDFLTQQQTDLLTAKTSLQDAIQKLNRTTRKMFMETFEKVKEQFRNYFKLLFNGGDAQVYLIDENDPLESGIEIVCRPPGKKLQNVMLLSGGEKSMSAIALIFAIFKVKPAPFCILDEIDAALDESNVDRFGRLLQEFSQTAQFIVITHNKRTIANADVMYGITMQESGVSKIVSVKFSDRQQQAKEKEPEAVAA